MNEKYFYVRQDSTIGNDDDETNGSTVFKVSDMISMGSSGDTGLALRFKPRFNAFGADQDDTTGTVLNKTDSVTLTTGTNAQKAVIEAILAEVAKPMIAGAPYLINLYDAVNANSDIKGVSGASVALAAAQS
tara:strand:+ start:67 stop:462 length:396 start_codon:yes stop_codon:yes gene_type:complete